MKIGIKEDGSVLEISAQDYVTKKVQILAKTDSGKTYTASKFCEELLKENQPIIIVDPVSAYWGLKEKFSIVVFGDARNKHVDYHLIDEKKKIDEQAELIADYLAGTNVSAIIDLKYWVESKQQQFMAAFASRLYTKNKIPRHVFIEEYDKEENITIRGKFKTVNLYNETIHIILYPQDGLGTAARLQEIEEGTDLILKVREIETEKKKDA